MTDIRSLIENIAQALGADASVEQVERVARLFLTTAHNGATSLSYGSANQGNTVHLAATSIGISLLDCSSRLPRTVAARAYDKIRRVAGLQRQVIHEISNSFGVKIEASGITVTPCSIILDSGTAADFVELAMSLEQAAIDVDVDYIAGFSAIAHHGLPHGASSLIDSLPEVMSATKLLKASLSCASGTGVNYDAVSRLSKSIAKARDSSLSSSPSHSRLFATCNTDGYDTKLDSSFHGIGEAELTVNVQLAAVPMSDGSPSETAEIATAIALSIAESLSHRSGYPCVVGRVLSGSSAVGALQGRPFQTESTLGHGQLSSEKIAEAITEDLTAAVTSGAPHRLICL